VPESLSELVKNYLELNENYSRAGTLANNKYLLDKYVLPDFGDRKPEAFTAVALLGLMKRLRAAGLATSTINKIRAVVSVVYATSIGFGLEVTNPAATVRPFWRPDHEKTQVQGTLDHRRGQTGSQGLYRNPIRCLHTHLNISGDEKRRDSRTALAGH